MVQGLQHLDRGYDNLEGKLRGIGANIQRGLDGAIDRTDKAGRRI